MTLAIDYKQSEKDTWDLMQHLGNGCYKIVPRNALALNLPNEWYFAFCKND